jgi:hypothetical protein
VLRVPGPGSAVEDEAPEECPQCLADCACAA